MYVLLWVGFTVLCIVVTIARILKPENSHISRPKRRFSEETFFELFPDDNPGSAAVVGPMSCAHHTQKLEDHRRRYGW